MNLIITIKEESWSTKHIYISNNNIEINNQPINLTINEDRLIEYHIYHESGLSRNLSKLITTLNFEYSEEINKLIILLINDIYSNSHNLLPVETYLNIYIENQNFQIQLENDEIHHYQIDYEYLNREWIDEEGWYLTDSLNMSYLLGSESESESESETETESENLIPRSCANAKQ